MRRQRYVPLHRRSPAIRRHHGAAVATSGLLALTLGSAAVLGLTQVPVSAEATGGSVSTVTVAPAPAPAPAPAAAPKWRRPRRSPGRPPRRVGRPRRVAGRGVIHAGPDDGHHGAWAPRATTPLTSPSTSTSPSGSTVSTTAPSTLPARPAHRTVDRPDHRRHRPDHRPHPSDHRPGHRPSGDHPAGAYRPAPRPHFSRSYRLDVDQRAGGRRVVEQLGHRRHGELARRPAPVGWGLHLRPARRPVVVGAAP